ncbi:MAG: hypothetical protein OWT28_04815, partial [Firmicutes bacterium]|nr:hypothetical protein [Bacillota bacterium]
YYYILLDGEIYPRDVYNKEVAEGKRSAKDIYTYVYIDASMNFDSFLFNIDYLDTASVSNIVDSYLRKMGFTITDVITSDVFPPTPNLKYFIRAVVKLNNHTPEYLVVSVYDIDSLARSLRIPEIVQQKLGSRPREITARDDFDIDNYVNIQPLLAGHIYFDAWHILREYAAFHNERFKDEAHKIALAYLQLFPISYEVCYEWKAGIFIETDCAKLVLLKRSS